MTHTYSRASLLMTFSLLALSLPVFATDPVALKNNEAKPTRFAPEALQQDGRITLSPSFTPDGRTLYLAQSECAVIGSCPQRLKRARLGPDGWSAPELIPFDQDARADWPFVSPDGKTLYFSWAADREIYAGLDVDVNFDLYTLDLTNPKAAPIAIKGGDINRPRAGRLKTLRYMHNEALASVTTSGRLYFMTEREDGIGERDIYSAQINAAGDISTAKPLPAPINSIGRDDGVWVNPSDTIMLLNYNGRGGSGGSDIFISFKDNRDWSDPINIGPVINSQWSDFGPRLSPDETTLYFSSDRPFTGQAAGLLQVWTAPIDVNALRRRAAR